MNFRTVLLFQAGAPRAIRDAAGNRYLLSIGFVLVLTAAIARNYDQIFILEKPWWPVGPLVFSAFSAFFIYLFVHARFLKRFSEGEGRPSIFWSQFVRFLGVFWMTAPLAWLYAIPVERFLASYPAAVVNVALLAVVASWRVWLLSRALAVLLEIQARDALLCVLLAASFELVLVSLAGCLSFVEIMGGLRHSPERILIANVTAFAFWGGLIIAVVAALLSRGRQTRPGALLPPSSKNGFPFFLPALLAIWMAVAVLPQREVARNFRLEHFLQEKRYADALNFLSTFQRSDFAASRRLPPDPYTYQVFRHLPNLFGVMNGSEAAWVRWEYLGHLEIALKHHASSRETNAAQQVVLALQRIPEGPAWARTHADDLRRIAYWERNSSSNDLRTLESELEKLGVGGAAARAF